MSITMENQLLLFMLAIATGGVLGFVYDIFRMLRKIFNHPNFLIYFEDVLYWLLVSFIMFYVMLFRNYGEIRFFSILGAFLGMLLYFLTLSSLFMKISVSLYNFLKKVFLSLLYIISLPFRAILKILSFPGKFLFKRLKKITISFKKTLQKSKRYAKIKGRTFNNNLRIALKKH